MRVAVLLGCSPREFPQRYVHAVVSSAGAGSLRSREVQYELTDLGCYRPEKAVHLVASVAAAAPVLFV